MPLFTTSQKADTPTPQHALPPEVQSALAKITEINSLPEVAARIVEIVEDPKASARDIYDVAQADPALATRILKIVNSAFYGLPAQIASLERAIVMLGLSAVRNLALASSLMRLLKPGPVFAHFTTRDLWTHSIAVGVCARAFARAGGRVAPDEAFVAGLVHDVGLIVLQQLFPDRVRQACERCEAEGTNLCVIERELLATDHQAVGGVLATRWKFPVTLRNAICYHHDPRALQPQHQHTAAIVYLADGVCSKGQYGFWLTGHAHELSPWMLELLRLTEQQVQDVVEALPDQIAEAEHVFGA